MEASDTQFLYMMLILPGFFGLILIGEGLNKVFNSEMMGWLNILFGFLFIGVIVFTYSFISG